MVTRPTRPRSTWAVLILAFSLASCGSPHGTPTSSPLPPSGPIAATRLFVEPSDGPEPLVSFIGHAQRSLFVEIYILTDSRIVHALERASAEGVDVRVILEPRALGMGTQPEAVADELRAAGIEVRFSSVHFPLDHAKFAVADDARVLVSTANFSRSAFSSNREFLVVLSDRAIVHSLSNLFRRDWDHLPAFPESQSLVVSPGARPVFLRLIARTRHTLSVDGEELLDMGIVRALERASRRGVRVRILLPISPAFLPSLRSYRIEVRVLRSPYMHAKMMLSDGRVAIVGSQNLSTQSLERNREVGVEIKGRLLRRLRAVFLQDWAAAHTP